ncbi:MAG: dUTP diphosphatase [Clostridia bacterium]|nr:dUTP diphosphatase [Clostridia bacterium]MBR6618922.1 dUTP diphosphatase [Clostridia bacterium]
MITEIKFKKLRENAKIPQRATPGSAGLDLCACIDEPITLAGGGHALIPTGLAIALEDSGYAAMIFARSGLAIKHGIAPANCVGVVDSDYRGEICVGLINQYEESYTIEPGERIAQLVVMPVCNAPTVEVTEIDETERGAGGFGSTGKK